jgi:phosphate uptake regulator
MSNLAVSMFETAIEALFRQDHAFAESIVEKTKDIISMEKEAVVSSQKIDVEDAP